MGGEEGVGIDQTAALLLQVVEEIDVELGVFVVVKEVDVGVASDEDVIDAGLCLFSCFPCHRQ